MRASPGETVIFITAAHIVEGLAYKPEEVQPPIEVSHVSEDLMLKTSPRLTPNLTHTAFQPRGGRARQRPPTLAQGLCLLSGCKLA